MRVSVIIDTIDKGPQTIWFEFSTQTASKITLNEFLHAYLPTGGKDSKLEFSAGFVHVQHNEIVYKIDNYEIKNILNTTLLKIARGDPDATIYINKLTPQLSL